jgi:hypothetical protein
MPAPTTSEYWNQTTPAAPTGDQNVVIQSDGATPQQQLTAYPKRMVGDTGSGGKAGTVPPPAAGDAAAGKFLKADGTFAVPPSSSPLTTKGDLFGHSTVDARIPVGSVGQTLVADPSQTLGVRYADRERSVGITIFGSDLASAGLKDYIQINFSGTIVGAAVEADVSGSASVEVWKKSGSAPPTAPSVPTSSDKISGSTPLAISTAQTAAYDAAALSGWSTLTVAKWDSIGFNLTGAATTSTKVKFVLYILET